jgi:hypothetical protein
MSTSEVCKYLTLLEEPMALDRHLYRLPFLAIDHGSIAIFGNRSHSIFAMINLQQLGLNLLDTFQLFLMHFRTNFNDFTFVFHYDLKIR